MQNLIRIQRSNRINLSYGKYFNKRNSLRQISMFMVFVMLTISTFNTIALDVTNDEPVVEVSYISDFLVPIVHAADIVTNTMIETEKEIDTETIEIEAPEIRSIDEEVLIEETILRYPNAFSYSYDIPLSKELQEYAYNACMEWDIDYALVLAIMWRESRFTINAVGYNNNGTYDSGLMQINDCNRGWLRDQYGIVDLLDPYENIDAGTIMLGKFIEKYGEHNGIMAYQYGEGGMQRRLNQGIYVDSSITKLMIKRNEFHNILLESESVSI